MRQRTHVITLMIMCALFLCFSGCSDDDDSTTGPVTTRMDGQQAASMISANLTEFGMTAVVSALSGAIGNFKGYEPPNLDDYTGDGFAKAVAPTDTTWYKYQNGWHIFYADETVVSEYEGTVQTFDFVVSDSAQLKEDGVAMPDPSDPDYVDYRSHVDGSYTMNDGTSTSTLDGDFYQRTLVELITNNDLRLNISELIDMDISGTFDDQTGSSSYVYEINASNIIFNESDSYQCPVSGTIAFSIDLSMTDQSGTMVASATATLTISSGGYVSGTVTAEGETVNFTYYGLCADIDASQMSPNPFVNLF